MIVVSAYAPTLLHAPKPRALRLAYWCKIFIIMKSIASHWSSYFCLFLKVDDRFSHIAGGPLD